MPSFRGISLSLHSQYDIMSIPEYTSPLSSHFNDATSSSLDDDENGLKGYPLATHVLSTRLTDVYIPIYPLSQFWIAYSVDVAGLSCDTASSASSEENGAGDAPEGPLDDVRFVYFKLFINGSLIVSWGVGAGEEWRGKSMFALFQAGAGRKELEKRGFFFAACGEDDCYDDEGSEGGDYVDCKDEEGVMEVRAYRARGRRRVRSEIGVAEAREEVLGVTMLSLGVLKRQDPRDFWQYALLDAKDEPWAVVRYHVCSNDQLLALGIVPGSQQVHDNSSGTGPEHVMQTPSPSDEDDDDDAVVGAQSPEADTTPALNTSIVQQITESTRRTRRLSIPPSKRLEAAINPRVSSSPIRQASINPAEEIDRHANRFVEDAPLGRGRLVRTPSPIKAESRPPSPASDRELQETRPSARRFLKSVVESALRRRTTDRSLTTPSSSNKDPSPVDAPNRDTSPTAGSHRTSLDSIDPPARVVNLDSIDPPARVVKIGMAA